jgi:ABC-2 type transport system ATP-binding protein
VNAEVAINAAGLTKRFGQTLALDGLDLTAHHGEMFALVGPDGAGKTTALRILAGVIRPDAGELSLLGNRVRRHSRSLKRRIGYLAQGFSLYGDLSVDENLAFFAEIYGVRDFRRRRDELLEFTRLTQFRTRLAGRLSGGMKKKLALACSLIHQPEIILLDEPTTGVDPVSRRDFWLILGRLLAEGLSIVVATPYLDEAERCQHVGLLRDGRFLAVGTPDEIRERVSGEFYEVVTADARRARRLLTAPTPDWPGCWKSRRRETVFISDSVRDPSHRLRRTSRRTSRATESSRNRSGDRYLPWRTCTFRFCQKSDRHERGDLRRPSDPAVREFHRR